MTFHYREVDLDKREPLIKRAQELILDSGYKVPTDTFTTVLFTTFFLSFKVARGAGERTRDLLILFIFSFHRFTAKPQRLPNSQHSYSMYNAHL
jgi:hypothetical protein